MAPRVTKEALDAAISAEERSRREESAKDRLLKASRAEKARLEELVDLLTAIDGIVVDPPEWTQPLKNNHKSHGIANLILSDLHLDEVVSLEQMGGRNKYDRHIAEMRFKSTIDKTIRMTRDYVSGLIYDGIVLWLLGDNGSGEIHDELRRTNAGQHTLETLDYWVDPITAGLEALADAFGNVRIICQIGNHGRTSVKPEAKNAVRSSYDWAFYRQLWRATRSDARFSWNISEAIGVKEQIYNTVYWAEHGDQFKGGDQIAGPVRPIMFGRTKRLDSNGPFDILLVGDKHTYATPPGCVMNGSLIGWNEWARGKGFKFDVPKQAFWVDTPEQGSAFFAPILPMNRGREGW